MATLILAIARTWERQKEYALRLLADLTDEAMVSQPVAGVVMNHPAWTFSHLSVYPPVLTAILRGEAFEDPLTSAYGRDSAPVGDMGAYARKDELIRGFVRVHDELRETLVRVDPKVLEAPIPLARWRERFPQIADVVVHLMVDHESGHLGQVSMWRRAGGRARV